MTQDNPFHLFACSGSGVISKKELKLFYTAFLDAGRLGDKKLSELTEVSYSAMTSNGDVQLSFHMYKLSFLNFLLGKQPNGPGEWLFGEVDREGGRQENFHIDFTLWSNFESKAVGGHAIAETVHKESEIEKVCCEQESEDVTKRETITSTECSGAETGLQSRNVKVQENVDEEDRKLVEKNANRDEITVNDKPVGDRVKTKKVEDLDEVGRNTKQDQRYEESKIEKKTKKEKAGRDVGEKVRTKRVEVTSKKSILV